MRRDVPDPPVGHSQVHVELRCRSCPRTDRVVLFAEDVRMWKAGRNPKVVFPYLSTEQQEMMIDDICPDCFNKEKS